MSTTGKRMRLGTKSCAECRRRKVRCIRPPGQDRCDACQAHGSSCLAQEKSGGRGDESPSSGADDVAVLKKRLDELEMLMRALPAAGRPASAHGADAALTDGSTAASASPHGPSPPPPPVAGVLLQHPLADPSPLVDAAQISPALQNSPLLSLFRESSIFDPITYADARPPLLTPSAAARLRQCLAQFAPYLPQPERVATFFDATQQYWPTWPPYFYPPGGDADRLGPGQVPRAEQTFHTALVSGRPAQTAKAVLFLALCIQQTPKRRFRSLVPPSVRQQDLVDTYVDTAQTLLQLDDDGAGGSTLDAVEAMNMLYKLCINAGRPRRAWSWNRRAITACIARGGLPTAAAHAGERAALAWSTAWRAERYMAMTLGLPSATSALHPGLAPLREERAAGAILHSLAVICGRIIDRDQDAGGDDYATTVQLGAELDEAQRRLFPAHWWAAGHLGPDLDQAAGWFRQSCKVLFLTARQVAHLPYLLRAAAAAAGEEEAAAAQYAPSRDAAMDAARGVCAAYCEFRHWARGGAELCQVMDFRAASAALVLVLGHWISSGAAPPADADAAAVRDVALCLRQTAAVMDCRVAEQAVRTLDVLDAARRGVYLADDDYDVVVPYFGRIRVNKAAFVPPQKPPAAASDFFNTVEFSTNDFLADFQLDTTTTGEAPAELCGDWADLGLGYASMDWDQSFTCGPFFEVDGRWDDSLLLGGGEGEMKQEI